MPVRHEHQHIAEEGSDLDTAEGYSGAADFCGVGVLVIRDYFALGKADKTGYKVIGLIARHVDAVFGNGFERRIGGGREVPIELHLQAAGPLDDCIHSDCIFERLDDDLGSGCSRGLNGLIHIGDEVSGALLAEGERNGGLVGEDGERADRSQQVLHLGAAGHGQDIGHAPLGGLASESRDEAVDEGVDVGGSDVDMSSVVLWADGDGCGWRSLSTRGGGCQTE